MNANVQLVRLAPDVRHALYAGWYVDVAANRIRNEADGREVRLTPKAMAVLRELLVRPGAVVKRDDLLGLVWRDGFPTDDVLTHAVTELRRAMDDDPRAPKLIETIPRVGYRLIGEVDVLAQAPLPVRRPDPVPDAEPASIAEAPVAAAVMTAPRGPLWVLTVLAAVLAAALIVALASGPRVDEADAPAAVAPSAPAITTAPRLLALTADPAREQFPSLSPDGSSVAYAAFDAEGRSRIHVRSLDVASSPRVLTDPGVGRDDYPVWSPDGTQIAFLRLEPESPGCRIMVMPALGGPARRVAACHTRTLDYIDWTADGKALLFTRWSRLPDGEFTMAQVQRLDLASGEATPFPYAPSRDEHDLQPRASPDGRWIAFRRGAAPYSDLWVMPADGGEPRRLTRLRAQLRGYAWYPKADALLVSSDHEGRQQLYRVELADGAVRALGVRDAQFPDVARRAGVVAFQQETPLTQLRELHLEGDRVVRERLIAPATRSDRHPAHSPDGSRLAFVSARSGDSQLWLYDAATENAFPLTRYTGVEVAHPSWSPDGRQVLHVVRGAGRTALHRIHIDSTRVERLGNPDENIRFGSFARDGAWIYYASDASGSWQAWRMRPDGSEAEPLSRSGAIDPRDPFGDGTIFYTRESERGLFRLHLASRTETLVSALPAYWNRDAWTVRDDGVYVLEQDVDANQVFLLHAPLIGGSPPQVHADKSWRRVVPVMPSTALLEMSLSTDGRRLVVVNVSRDDTDLMAFELTAP